VVKEKIRSELLKNISLLPHDEIQSLSFNLTNQLIKFISSLPELSEQIVGAYLPLKFEIAPVYQELLKEIPLNLAYPVLIEGQMAFGIPNGMPRGGTWLDQPYHLVEPNWFLVPGVAFDFKGTRLGRGKGYFDRYFDNRDVLKVGIAWSGQMIENVPFEQHDCQMDFIITEEFCWDVSQQLKF